MTTCVVNIISWRVKNLSKNATGRIDSCTVAHVGLDKREGVMYR